MEKYIPDMYQKSIFDINYKRLKKEGIKCLLIDFDNTMVIPHNKKITKKLKNLIEEIKKLKIKVIIFSNTYKKNLINPSKELGVDFVSFARKPLKGKYQKALEKYKYDVNEVATIGDQLKTDIVGGNKVGITTILVNPLSKKDKLGTKINRFFENIIFKKLGKKDLMRKGKYYE